MTFAERQKLEDAHNNIAALLVRLAAAEARIEALEAVRPVLTLKDKPNAR